MAEQRLTTEDFASPHKHTDSTHTDSTAEGHGGTRDDAAGHDLPGHDRAGHDTAGHDTAGYGTAGHDADTSREWREQDATGGYDGREPVEQTPSDRDVAEPHLTDQERYDAEPVAADGTTADRTTDDGTTDDRTTDDEFIDETAAGEVGAAPVEHSPVAVTASDAPLFTTDDATNYRDEWRALQADFVDDPREAVQRADELVAQVIQSLATTFAEHKRSLEGQWQQGEQVETEELRQALKRYRSFFDRLLSV
ncbi:hypothetical protein [Saccharothrix sp. Mg75]|uniref:hypothetical protein n=1 Tax=Saccharothrix sp. Mg75 TaxID=3445357 RepID=UPI003EF002E6